MQISKIAPLGVLSVAMVHAPLAAGLILAFLAVVTALFFRWFARQPKRVRADVVQLISALRRK